MRIQQLSVILVLFISQVCVQLHAQPCTSTRIYQYGKPDSNERGYSLLAAGDNQSYYISALYDDAVLLLHVDLKGTILFSRAFDIVPGTTDHGNMVMMDDEGMLVFTGMTGSQTGGGNVIVFRYNPGTDQVLWTKEFDTHWLRNYSYSIIQLGAGGNYVICNNPHQSSNDDSELIMLDKNTGNVVPDISTLYNLSGNSETLSAMLYHNGFIYGSGRYTSENQTSFMRNTLTKIDPTNGNTVWATLGHRSSNMDARLYGTDLVIHNGLIYSISTGDPAGTGSANWHTYLQCTNLDGEVLWFKEYNVAGGDDVGIEVVYHQDGIVALVHQRSANDNFTLFKVDLDGNVLWSSQFPANTIINTDEQLITLGDKLVFTGITRDATGNDDILVVQTNAQGIPDHPCVPFAVSMVDEVEVQNPIFFNAIPTQSPAEYTVLVREAVKLEVSLETEGCTVVDTVYATVEASICEGESYEGYSQAGTYTDEFTTAGGCDSIRILVLTIEACQPECAEMTSSVFGEVFVDEHGRCLVASSVEQAVYIAGNRDQNTIIIKMDYSGSVIWTRVFDVVPEGDEVPAGILEDSDGMLVIVGTGGDYSNGGTVYGFRYDPNADIMLWANEYQNSPNDFSFGVIEKGPGGNYLFNNQATHNSINNQYAEVVEIDRNTGTPNPSFSKNYQIIGTETLYELAYIDNAVFGVGRYKDGGINSKMRNTLTKLNPVNGDQIWVKMGHRPEHEDARLYGSDFVFDNNGITSIYSGDPAGTSTSNTKVYLQQTDLNGNLVWLNQYEIPGSADYSRDLLATQDGYIMLVHAANEDNHYLIKVDHIGEVLWANQYAFAGVSDPLRGERGNPLLIQAGQQLFFTGGVTNASGDEDLLVVITDHLGNVQTPCVESFPIVIEAVPVDNPTWYNKQVIQFDVDHVVTNRAPQSEELPLPANAICGMVDTLFSELAISICQGQSFENYTESGIYQDTFVTAEGCDSIRILTLTVTPPIEFLIRQEICSGESFMGFSQTGVYADTFSLTSGCDSIRTLRLTVLSCEPVAVYDLDACRSYMSDGSIMDYSEFDPEYPNGLDCGTVTATNLFRSPPAENKHSCTDGLNGTLAMCISALNSCTYQPGNNASAIIEITFTPDQDSTIAFNKIEFYEKAPVTYSWIDGPSGPNNYPRYYGIRILKNGTQVFEQHDIATSLTWALQTYTFNNLPEFKVTGTTTFRIELLPYCPIGNAAPVSAWDLEDIRLFASCAPEDNAGLVINGTAATWNETPVYKATIQLSATSTFESITPKETTSIGTYRFDDVRRYHQYHLKAEKNTNLLQGVNTRDIIVLQKHLLGKQTFNGLDQYIAGDINHTGTINAIDMIELRKAILGMQDEFTNNTSWRFAVKPVDLESRDMDDFIETAYIESLFEPTAIDWLGVKIGDVNRDAGQYLNGDPIITRSDNTFNLVAENIICKAGELMTIDFVAEELISLEGLQLAMEISSGEIVAVHQGHLPLTKEHYYIDADGKLRMSWSEANPVLIEAGDVVMSVTFRATSTQPLAELINMTSQLNPELYTIDEVRPVALKLYDKSAPATVILQQVTAIPNPFMNEFTIQFTVPAEGVVNTQIFTPLVEVVYTNNQLYEAGDHQEVIRLPQLKGARTMLFCQLQYAGHTETLKVIKLE